MTSTKERILKAGLKLWPDVTGQAVADKVGVSRQRVNQYFPQGSLKDAIAKHAVEVGHSNVIVQLIAADHEAADGLSPAERAKHFDAI